MAFCLLWLFACGEDQNKSTATRVNAPSTLVGQTYDLISADTTSIAFAGTGNTYILTQPGSRTDSGTYTATRSGDTWNVTLTSSTTGTAQSELVLTFSSDGVGTFTFREANSATPVTGQFQRSASTASIAKPIEASARERIAVARFPNAPQGASGNYKTGTPVGAFALTDAV